MELNEKALNDFWIWYLLPEQQNTYKTNSLIKFGNEASAKVRFLAMSFTERFGVFVDFLDSVEIEVRVNGQKSNIKYYESFTNGYLGAWKTRNEARTEAIKKANEIYNNIK